MYTPFLATTGVAGYRALDRTKEQQLETLRKDPETAASIKYFEENIGKVRNAAELVADRRLLEVAMIAYGLETELDKGALITRALEEGVESEDAFANRLSDPRWVAFSRDFGFGSTSAGYEVSSFQAAVELSFRPRLTPKPAISEDAFVGYRAGVASITSVDALLAEKTTLDVLLKSFGLERDAYTDAHFHALAAGTGDMTGLDYADSLPDPATRAAWRSVATALAELEAPSPATVPRLQVAVEKNLGLNGVNLVDSQATADASSTKISEDDLEYFKATVESITTSDAFVNDARLSKVAMVAFGLDPSSVSSADLKAMVDSAAAGDLSVAQEQGVGAWAAFASAVGATLNGETASHLEYSIEVQLGVSRLETPPTAPETPEIDQAELDYFKSKIGSIANAADLVADERLLTVALTAFGLENEGKSTDYIKSILEEDAYGEAAFVNLLSDDRWARFAKAFQPSPDGGVSPSIMQYAIEERLIERGAPAEDLETVRANFRLIDSNLDLILFPDLMQVTISAFGLPKDTYGNSFFTSALISDPNNKNSFANRIGDDRWVDLARTIGLYAGTSGNVGVPSFVKDVTDKFADRSFEIAVGNVDQDLRLALNFAREIKTVAASASVKTAGWYQIMGSEPLRQVVDRAFGLPSQFSQLAVETQRDEYKTRSSRLLGGTDPSVFKDPAVVTNILTRFLAAGASDLTGAPGYGAVQMMSMTAAYARSAALA